MEAQTLVAAGLTTSIVPQGTILAHASPALRDRVLSVALRLGLVRHHIPDWMSDVEALAPFPKRRMTDTCAGAIDVGSTAPPEQPHAMSPSPEPLSPSALGEAAPVGGPAMRTRSWTHRFS
ncbi:unnamed protein product [Lampetra fluviatilis]